MAFIMIREGSFAFWRPRRMWYTYCTYSVFTIPIVVKMKYKCWTHLIRQLLNKFNALTTINIVLTEKIAQMNDVDCGIFIVHT
jgi:hypothetical protein